jgi:trehalose 2-sulfotransferase
LDGQGVGFAVRRVTLAVGPGGSEQKSAQMNIHTSYAICAVQRSGSFLLCEALKNSGLAGMPEEYFLYKEDEGFWENGWWTQQHGVTSRRRFIDLVLAKGTTANGVFGAKLMWNYFPHVIRCLQELPEYQEMEAPQLLGTLLPNLHYIWLVRADKVRQAVSWAVAAQTDIYAAWQAEIRPPKQEPVFDFAQIDLLYNLILEGEAGWQAFFQVNKITPLRVVYEELVDSYEATALQILDYLEVTYPQNLVFGERRLKKQAAARNDEWADKYREMKQQVKDADST